MKVSERIAKLRALMAEKGIDAYVVPTADFHQSEYVGEHFKARKYITGFSGSYGTAVICQDDAGLWTDGRYFFQATNELEGSGTEYPHCGPCDLEFKPAAFGGSGPPGTLSKAVYGATARNPACQPVAVRF